MYFGDIQNAFQQLPPPSIQCFLHVDNEIEDYYLKKFGIKLDRLKDVIPLYHVLQGHPEAGAERILVGVFCSIRQRGKQLLNTTKGTKACYLKQ